MSSLKLFFYLLVATFVSTQTFAQKGPDTLLINEFTNKGKALIYQFPDSSIKYFEEALHLADSLKVPRKIAESKHWIGVAYYFM